MKRENIQQGEKMKVREMALLQEVSRLKKRELDLEKEIKNRTSILIGLTILMLIFSMSGILKKSDVETTQASVQTVHEISNIR